MSEYWWCALASGVGVVAGGQGVDERYSKDFVAGATTIPGVLYLGSRAILPAATFALCYAANLFHSSLWMWAILCGTGSELILRAKFFLKSTGGDVPQDVLVGPFDLLKFWQNVALTYIGNYLARKRKRFVRRNLPTGETYEQTRDRVLRNLASLGSDELAAKIGTAITAIDTKYAGKLTASNDDARHELGYAVYALVHREQFKALIEKD